MAIHKGYKDPPVPRRLVGESQIPPSLSPAYTGSRKYVSRFGLAGELEPKQVFNFVGYQFDIRSGRVRPTLDRWQNLQEKILKLLSLPTCPVREFMSLIGLLTATEKQVNLGQLHMRPIQWHLKNNWRVPESLEKVIPIPRSLTPFTMVAERRQGAYWPTITPNKTCSANFYRRIKRRVWRSFKRAHCKRILVPSGKQAAYKLPRTQGSFSSLKRVPRSLFRQDSTCSNRQHYSSVLHKQGRRDEVGPTWCPTVENLDLLYQKTSDSQFIPTHSRPAERGSRQAIQAGSDHPDRMVSPSRGFQSNIQQVAPATDRPFCHKVQQEVTSVSPVPDPLATAVDGFSLPWEDLDAYAFPPAAILGKVVEKLQDSPCKRIILIALGWPNMPWFWDLVSMSSQIPLSLPILPNLLTQPFNQIPHKNLTNLNPHAWLLEPQQSRNRASLRQWQQELRLLKGDQPDQSMRQSGPFLQLGASLIRWTSGHPLLSQ